MKKFNLITINSLLVCLLAFVITPINLNAQQLNSENVAVQQNNAPKATHLKKSQTEQQYINQLSDREFSKYNEKRKAYGLQPITKDFVKSNKSQKVVKKEIEVDNSIQNTKLQSIDSAHYIKPNFELLKARKLENTVKSNDSKIIESVEKKILQMDEEERNLLLSKAKNNLSQVDPGSSKEESIKNLISLIEGLK